MTSGDHLCCIVYMSRATKRMTEQELDALLRKSRAFNDQVGVTGVLLHHHDIFLQYIEGECGEGKGLDQVYQRIKGSSEHSHVDELLHHVIDKRLFAQWSMGSSYVSKESLLSLENANWQGHVDDMKRQQSTSGNLGLDVLLSVLVSIQHSPDELVS